MTTWIIVIRKQNPEHWGIAQEVGYWDMLKHVPIAGGDELHFWQSSKSFVGSARASAAARPIEASDAHPWNDNDAYTWRVALTSDYRKPTSTPRWGEVERELGKRVSLRGHVPRFDGRREEVLAAFFEPALPDGAAYRDAERLAELEALGFDMRTFDMRAIARRRGQTAFRRELLSTYGGACAISGFSVEAVLEAAHISPYKGSHTDKVYNGLILRADIHTLFDLNQITVLPNYAVAVAPTLRATGYGDFHGRGLVRLPEVGQRPDEELLRQHNSKCDWLALSRFHQEQLSV